MNKDFLKEKVVKPTLDVIDSIVNPENKIIERLQNQLKVESANVSGYSRMHNRHNRS